MKKLVISAAMLASLAAPAFAQPHYRVSRHAIGVEQQALRAQAYAPRGFAYSLDNERASTLSPGSTFYQPDANR